MGFSVTSKWVQVNRRFRLPTVSYFCVLCVKVEAERRQTEATRRKYQQRLLEVEADLDSQKAHMLAQFDGVLRQREHEHRCKLDEMSSVLESRDQRVSSLSSDCTALQAEVAAVKKELDDRTAVHEEKERKGQEIQWRLQEEANMYRGR